MLFADRQDAGRQLANKLSHYADPQELLVLALPRGGVVVGFEVAQALHAPLDLFVVRKLGVPGQEELAMGAIAPGGVRIVNADIVHELNLPQSTIDAVTERELRELERREQLYRGGRGPLNVRGKTVILVDDGLATGSTMRASARALFNLGPNRTAIAVPVGSPGVCEELRTEIGVDELVVLATPQLFHAVGEWYQNFEQVNDEQVRDLLARSFTATQHYAA